MTKKQAIKESIAHWERMIKYMKRRRRFIDVYTMKMESGEAWLGKDCALCTEYYKSDDTENCCMDCPLDDAEHCCFDDVGLWEQVQYATDRKSRIKAMENMLVVLKTLK
jgi:hypothetical protein